MAGTMRCLLVIILTLLISTVSGVIESSSVKGVPRLNNSLYCDYYFTCHTQGETLQWIVGNNTLSKYFGNSTAGSVLTGSVSNCNFIATLLSLKPLSFSRSFKSALILTCQSNFDMSIICSDGFLSRTINIPEKELNLRAETYNNSVYLEHVLSQNLVNEDNSTCTNVFVCGVNDRFMNVQLGDVPLGFSNFDSIGRERHVVQGTSVEQQAIFIDNEPYSLVVAMFLVDSEIRNVTCGSPSNIIFLSSMECPVIPETTSTTESESSTTESESSTVGESSTMVTEINLPLILGLSIPFGFLLLVVLGIIMTIVLGCLYNKSRERKLLEQEKKQKTAELERIPTEDELDSKIPLRGNFSKIKEPKEMMNIDYNEFFNRVQYIFLTRNERTFNAATTILTAPDIEKTTNEQLTRIDEDVYIGMIRPYPIESHPIESHPTESHPVCLVNEIGSDFLEKLKNVIIKYFPDAKYIVFIGRCFGIDPTRVKLADIVISKSIRHADEHMARSEFISPEIRSKFCFYPESATKYEVAQNRKAEPIVANIASGVNLLNDNDIRSFAVTGCDGIYGCEETSGDLLSLFKPGISMEDNTTKQMQIISIGAVTGYADKEGPVNEYVEWQFIASEAAFHYAASKMTTPHTPGNISYEIKKPKPRFNENFNNFTGCVQYIILTIGQDEFDAVTTHISAPELEESIIEIYKEVYIGKIGSHSVGLLYLPNALSCLNDMENAIVNYFPNAKYFVRVGGCFAVDKSKTDLGDVLISNEIFNIHYDGLSYICKPVKMTPEIQDIFCSSDDVEGLLLPDNRTAKHFEVRIATGSGADIRKDKPMKAIAIENKSNHGYDELGGDLLLLQEKMATMNRKIHFILIDGVYCYKYSDNYNEWHFVASQAAIHYVAAKMNMQ